ncbi:MAG: hypothetical protein AB7G13_33805, partial [Lautropia sp.]
MTNAAGHQVTSSAKASSISGGRTACGTSSREKVFDHWSVIGRRSVFGHCVIGVFGYYDDCYYPSNLSPATTLTLEEAVRLESAHDRMEVARRVGWAARRGASAGALRRGEERTAGLGARSALPTSLSPPLFERSERSERSEFGGASPAGAPQRTRRAAPGTPLKPAEAPRRAAQPARRANANVAE